MKKRVYLILYPPGDGLDVSAICYGSQEARDAQALEDLDEIIADAGLDTEDVRSLDLVGKCAFLDESGRERPTLDDQDVEFTP